MRVKCSLRLISRSNSRPNSKAASAEDDVEDGMDELCGSDCDEENIPADELDLVDPIAAAMAKENAECGT